MSVLCSSFMRLGFYGLRMWASFYLCEMRHLLGGPEHSDMTSQFATKNPSKQFKSLTVATAMYSVIIAVVTVSDFNCFDGFFLNVELKKTLSTSVCVCLVGNGAGSVGRRAGFGDGSATAGERYSGAT